MKPWLSTKSWQIAWHSGRARDSARSAPGTAGRGWPIGCGSGTVIPTGSAPESVITSLAAFSVERRAHLRGVRTGMSAALSDSRGTRKRIESCELARELRHEQRQDLAFHCRPFVLCRITIRRPETGTVKYARRNGRVVLMSTEDRLLPSYYSKVPSLPAKSQKPVLVGGGFSE